MIGLLGGKALKHQPPSPVLRFSRRVRIKRVAAALDRQRQVERIANDGCGQALLFVQAGGFLLFLRAGFTESENGVTAVSLLKLMLLSHALDQVFDSAGRKFDRASARV